jgi:periplasmic protein TonB
MLPSTDADHADTQYRIALPAISTRLGEYGRVLVRVQVGTDGRALQVQLLKSSGYARLDDNALATVARWRFKPGSVNGVPTVGWVEQPVNYAAQ